MLIRCWGAQGSIPVSGPQYLKYGGDTTCIEVRTGAGDVIVIDAGSGIRRLGNLLLAEGNLDAYLLLTHAHWDHLLGFPFFKPLYHRAATIGISGCSCAQSSVKEIIADAMSPPNFPIPLHDVHARLEFHPNCHDTFDVCGLAVTPIALSHPGEGLGYKFVEGDRSFVFLTDNELGHRHAGGGSFDDYVRFCAGADLLIHDAEFTAVEYGRTRTWGHSVVSDALELALSAGVKELGLFHHNQDRRDEEIDVIVDGCRQTIASRGAALECFAVGQGMEWCF